MTAQIITTALVTLILGYVVSSTLREAPEVDGEEGVIFLRYGSGARRIVPIFAILAILCCLLPFVLEAFTWPVAFGLGGFVAIATVLLALEVRSEASFDAEGVYTKTVWAGEREARWDDVQRVGYGGPSSSFWLRQKSGPTVRVRGMFLGADLFAQTLVDRFPKRGGPDAATRWQKQRDAHT